jgi:hypothetical protein
MLTAPDLELDVIVMTNRAGKVDPQALAKKVIDATVTGLAPVAKEAPGAGTVIEGTFHDAVRGQVITLAEKKGVTIADLYAAKVPTRRAADGSLWINAATLAMTIRPAGDAVEIEEWGRRDHYERVAAPEKDGTGAIAGRWACKAANVEALVEAGEPASLRFSGPLGSMTYRLAPIVTGPRSAASLPGSPDGHRRS